MFAPRSGRSHTCDECQVAFIRSLGYHVTGPDAIMNDHREPGIPWLGAL